MRTQDETRSRFASKFRVTPSCWEWSGVRDRRGYGKFWDGLTHAKAHRASYRLYVGPIENGMHVLHRCDNPACVNPNHLFLGTHADNMEDKTRKGRSIGAHAGENHHFARLTPDAVLAIRAEMRPYRLIAADYGISMSYVGDIRRGIAWKHI